MKKTILILLLFISFQSFTQKWHLNSFDSTKVYIYEYWISFQNEEDTSSYTGLNISNCSGVKPWVRGKITDVNNNPIPVVEIRIRNKRNDSTTVINTDTKGHYKTHLDTGFYSFTINCIGYKELVLNHHEDWDLSVFNIKLGKSPELRIYQIDSKTELSESKINEIMNCVKSNRESLDNCSDSNKYKISIHI